MQGALHLTNEYKKGSSCVLLAYYPLNALSVRNQLAFLKLPPTKDMSTVSSEIEQLAFEKLGNTFSGVGVSGSKVSRCLLSATISINNLFMDASSKICSSPKRPRLIRPSPLAKKKSNFSLVEDGKS
jgi:hypothetical protein